MQLTSLGDVIATRSLRVKIGEDEKEVLVSVGKPQPFDDGTGYYCPHRIDGIGPDKIRYGAGVDAIQALLLALKMIGALLYTSDEFKTKRLYWFEGMAGLGFPVEDVIKDLVPSDDVA